MGSKMESKIVVLHYNPEKFAENSKSSLTLVNGTSNIDFSVDNSTFEDTNIPSSRIVKLQYSNKNSEYFEGSDGLFLLSPSKSVQLHVSRSATPPTLSGSQEVATINNSQDSTQNNLKKPKKKSRGRTEQYTSIYRPYANLERNMKNGRSSKSKDRMKSQSQLKNGHSPINARSPFGGMENKETPKYIPASRTYKEAISSMSQYNDAFKSDINLQELEDDWLFSTRIVADRLNFLKEAYKAVQTAKKNKTQGKSEPNTQLHLNSSVVNSSLYLEEEPPSSSQSQQPLLHNDDEDSGSNSNTDSFLPMPNLIL